MFPNVLQRVIIKDDSGEREQRDTKEPQTSPSCPVVQRHDAQERAAV